jgi:hypothetical protein
VTNDGLTALLKLQDSATGVLGGSIPSMYEQAIGSLALVETYAMTGDKKLKQPCQLAIDVIVKSQAKDGGWRYELRENPSGDVSITGWAIQALTTAERHTDLIVPKRTLDNASLFLEKCIKNGTKASFNYTIGGGSHPERAATASGLCSMIALGLWGPGDEQLASGVDELLRRLPSPKDNDPYFMYYATRAVSCHGGEAWTKLWNPKLQEYLLTTQDKKGFWPAPTNPMYQFRSTGELGCSCLYLLALETYYRYPPSKGTR